MNLSICAGVFGDIPFMEMLDRVAVYELFRQSADQYSYGKKAQQDDPGYYCPCQENEFLRQHHQKYDKINRAHLQRQERPLQVFLLYGDKKGKHMRVLFVNGSSHVNGTTMAAIDEMRKVFEAEGVETEVFQLRNNPVMDCLQCNRCNELGRCVFENDLVNAFVERAKESDGFVFATPVYFAHPSGRIIDFLDRAFYSNCRDEEYDAFRFKPGAAVAVARRGGTTAALDALNKYFGIAQMPIAGSTYWNNVHGLFAEEAPQDEEGMQTMRNLARNMIWMMRCFEAGKAAGVPYPATETTACTNFIKRNDNQR